MRSFQHKRGFNNILHSRPVLVLLGILVLVFAWGVIGFMGKMEITTENKKIAESKVAELEQQKEKLSSEISKLNTEEGKEESIRERFPVAKDGESVIVIVDDKNSPKVPPEANSGGFFSFLKNLFK